jgi:hypothetical protein
MEENIRKDNKIEKYFYLKNKIKTINQVGSSGNSPLHVVNCCEYNEIVQFLIPNNALKSFENLTSQLTLNDQSKKAKEFREQIDLYKTYDI